MLNAKSLTGIGVVIGAGTMGGGIAAQLANAGWQARLLDVAGPDPNDRKIRNQAAAAGLERVKANRPPLLFLPEYAGRIQVGNTADNMDWLRDADWIVEAVAENRGIKQAVMAQIEAHAGPETVVSSNTSGLSLHEMTAHCRPEFRRRFLGSHFLNPPRYLKLLEVIPLPETSPEVGAGFRDFAEQVLGHRVVFARDTPGFISTRIWIAHLLDSLQSAIAHGLTVEEIDYLTGPLLGRPRSATCRMADLVGFDIIAAVAKNQYESLIGEIYRPVLPDEMQRCLAEGRTGAKSGAGFYKREGKEILVLDLKTFEYRPQKPVRIEAVEELMKLPLSERFIRLNPVPGSAQDQQENWRWFLWGILVSLHQFVSEIGPEIADNVQAIDRVMQWGFGWEMGPFEIAEAMFPGYPKYYSGTGSKRRMRVFHPSRLQPIPAEPEYIVLAELKAAGKTVLDSPEGSLIDLGDGVACLEFHTKMNTFNPALCAFVNAARERTERDFAALVIGNQEPHFSAGYDLARLLAAAEAEDWNALDALLHEVQTTFQGLKYARIPIVAAPHGYTLGAGLECALHCTAIQAAPELYAGFPETSAGVIPGGGGFKELLLRFLPDEDSNAAAFPAAERAFDLIAFPRNSGSAAEARKMGLLRPSDRVSRNADHLLHDAKRHALELANSDWLPPVKKSVTVLGADGLAWLRWKLHDRYRAGALTEHDRLLADRVAFVLSGGALPTAQKVSEDTLLRLEREVFLTLVREPKSFARMRHVLETGRPLKN